LNDEIAAAKKAFLAKYNRNRTDEEAESKAIGAAMRFNRVYEEAAGKIRPKLRACFRKKWIAALHYFSPRCALPATVDDVCKLVVELQERMLDAAKTVPIIVDFRLSHAQKSLSVYCKHLWCMGRLCRPCKPREPREPAICPVDRRIMTAVGTPVRLRAWGRVDDIATYKKQLRLLQDAVAKENQDAVAKEKKSLAVWELLTFQAGQP